MPIQLAESLLAGLSLDRGREHAGGGPARAVPSLSTLEDLDRDTRPVSYTHLDVYKRQMLTGTIL